MKNLHLKSSQLIALTLLTSTIFFSSPRTANAQSLSGVGSLVGGLINIPGLGNITQLLTRGLTGLFPEGVSGLLSSNLQNLLSQNLSQLFPEDLKSLLTEFDKIIASANNGEVFQAQLNEVIAEYLPEFKDSIAGIVGQLGLPDPNQFQTEILKSIAQPFDGFGVPTIVSNDGKAISFTTSAVVQSVLGMDGQKRLNSVFTNLKSNIESIGKTALLVDSAAKTSATISDSSIEAVNNTFSAATDATIAASLVDSLSTAAQSAVSSQDVLKLLAQQNGSNAVILAGISSQLANGTNVTSNVGSGISVLSEQNSQMSGQNANSSQIAAQQLSLQVEQTKQGATQLLNLGQINSQLKDQKNKSILELNSALQARPTFTFAR